MKLFRDEAINFQQQRLTGGVVMALPTPFRVFSALLAGAALVAAAILIFGTYARRETVSGWITPDRGISRAVAASGGRVERVLVHEGQRVAAGTVIATVRVSPDIDEGSSGDAAIASLSAEAAAARTMAQTRLASLSETAVQLRAHHSILIAERHQIDRQIILQEERVQLADASLARFSSLAQQGLFPRVLLEERQSEGNATRQELANLRQRRLELGRDLSDAAAQLAALPNQRMTITADAAVSNAQLDQRLIEVQAHNAYVVRAALSGDVAALPVREGQSIQSGATVAAIVPDGSALVAELYAPSRAAGFIRPGQAVRLLYQAFPYQRFGAGEGVVTEVSNTVLTPNDVAVSGLELHEPVFRVEVRLKRPFVMAYGRRTAIQPGMLLSADVVLERRSLLQWLFDPLYAASRR